MQYLKLDDKIKTKVEKITLELIDENINNFPIINIDAFLMFKVYHYPHFITILSKEKKGNKELYKVYDTWDGKIKEMQKEELQKAIDSFRNYLKMCPQMIRTKHLNSISE